MKTVRTSFTITALLALMFIAGIAYVANAQEVTTPQERFQELREQAGESRTEMEAAREERVAEMEAAREEKITSVEALREERTAALQERMQERITNLATNISKRMEAAIARITQIMDRLEERMLVLEDAGVNTAEAQVTLAEARSHLQSATIAITGIDAVISNVVESESPREAWATGKEAFMAIKTDIKAGHEGLRDTVSRLKEAVAESGVSNGVSGAVNNTNRNQESGDFVEDEGKNETAGTKSTERGEVADFVEDDPAETTDAVVENQNSEGEVADFAE